MYGYRHLLKWAHHEFQDVGVVAHGMHDLDLSLERLVLLRRHIALAHPLRGHDLSAPARRSEHHRIRTLANNVAERILRSGW